MRIYLDSVGCRLNQSEIEAFGQQFRAHGHHLVPSAEQADLAVINTCAVTVEAAADSRKLLRRAARQGAGQVIGTGCWVSFDPETAARLTGPDGAITNSEKDSLVAKVLHLQEETFDLEPVVRAPLPGARLRTRAFIKVQDGCDNRCTFCVTTLLRGEGRSRPAVAVLQDIKAAIDGGSKEVVLTGVHLGSWGQDLGEDLHLKDLVEFVMREAGTVRVRLSSVEPWDLEPDFFELWARWPSLCRHLHLPLQSGCDSTLRRMARKTTQAAFRHLVETARSITPDLAITTDLIAGFPGETEEEFRTTMKFVEEMAFAGAHVFTYSERPGTAAAAMPGMVPHPIRRERSAALRNLVEVSARTYRRRFIGSRQSVLWESTEALGPEGWQMSGLTDNYLRVTATASQDYWNDLTPVDLIDERDGRLIGQLALGTFTSPSRRQA